MDRTQSTTAKPGIQEQGLLAITLIGLVGIYYKSWGAALAFVLVALTTWTCRREVVNSSVVRLMGILVAALMLGSLFSANPMLSLRGCLKIAEGMLFFAPGLYLGKQLQKQALAWWQLAPLALFYLAHFLYPSVYDGNLIFGFSKNPNTIGQGVTYALFLLGIVFCSEETFRLGTTPTMPSTKRAIYVITLSTLASLLIIANCRQGWLAVGVGISIFYLANKRVQASLKFLALLAALATLGILVSYRDYKGFGYGSVGERLDLWTRSLSAWLHHHPWFGAGFASFEAMAKDYYYGNVTRIYWHPHNISVEILYSGGLWAAVVIAIFLIKLVQDYRHREPLSNSGMPRLACLGAIAGMLIVGQFDMGITSIRLVSSLATFLGFLDAQYTNLAPKLTANRFKIQ